jgi:hypothetical protein
MTDFACRYLPLAYPPTPPELHPMNNDDSNPDTIRNPDMGTLCALDQAIAKLGRDEHRVLTRIAERLVLGATTYGPLVLERDSRSFRSREPERTESTKWTESVEDYGAKRSAAREEVEDALVYLACAWLKGEEVAS